MCDNVYISVLSSYKKLMQSVNVDINGARCGRGKNIASAPAQQTTIIKAEIIFQ